MRILITILIAILFGTVPVHAQNRIGETVDSKTRVVRTGVGGQAIVATLTPVFQNDRLQANNTGLAQIRFVDDTKIVVGPGANVTLDDFVFSGSTSTKKLSVSVTKGAFRWISGQSSSSAYSVKTPSGSIGIRGTAFDVTISRGSTNVLLLQGQVNICPRNAPCKRIRKRCDFVLFDRNGIIEEDNLLQKANIRRYERVFPMLKGQRRLHRPFRRETAGCKSQAAQSGREPTPVSAPAAAPPAPPAPPDPPAPEPEPGNPGNDKDVGKAGLNPNGKGFGNRGRGRSDADRGTVPMDSGPTESAESTADAGPGDSGTGGGGGGKGGKGGGGKGGGGKGGGQGGGKGGGHGGGKGGK